MKPRFPVLLAALAASALTSMAQQTPSLSSLQAALKVRADIATAVGRGAETPERGLQQLRKAGLAQDADLAYAALDVAHRLLGAEHPTEAEVFFHSAEQAFEQALKQAAGAREKAQYLQKLAEVRGKYLNKIAQAKADIDEAIRLQPNDKSLIESRSQLARVRGEHIKEPKRS